MYGLRGVTLLLCSIAVQSILAQDDGIVFNPPLDPDSKNNFNYLDRLNVSVLPYRPRTDPKVLLACLSNKTGADGALISGTSEPVQEFWDVIALKQISRNALSNCQITWADGELVGRSRNFSISHNGTAKPTNWGFQPRFFAPEINGGHQFTYPTSPSGRYITVNANDNMTVSWTQGGSAQATVLGIECWARSANQLTQSDGDPVKSGPITTVNATEVTVPMAGYAGYGSCAFTLKNSIPDTYTEVSDRVYISNATAQGGQTWSVGSQAPTNLTASSGQPVSGAAVLGGSILSLVTSVCASAYLLAA